LTDKAELFELDIFTESSVKLVVSLAVNEKLALQ